MDAYIQPTEQFRAAMQEGLGSWCGMPLVIMHHMRYFTEECMCSFNSSMDPQRMSSINSRNLQCFLEHLERCYNIELGKPKPKIDHIWNMYTMRESKLFFFPSELPLYDIDYDG
jgi:hypothetical protein